MRRVTEQEAAATVAWAWPDAVELVRRNAGILDGAECDYAKRFDQAVVVTLAAEAGMVADRWAAEQLLHLATEAVPGLLDDLREARTMATRMDAESLAEFLASTTHWPGAPERQLKALVTLRPELADVIRRRARALGHHDPLEHRTPSHIDLADLDRPLEQDPDPDQEDPTP